jgi:hypothetical protein
MAQTFSMINHQILSIDARIKLLDFSIKGCITKDNQINFFNYKFTFKRFGKKYKK